MREFIESLPRSTQHFITVFLLFFVAFLHFTNLPSAEIKPIFGIDKIAHLVIFFTISSWSCLVFSGNRIRQFAIFLILYGLFLELTQMTLITDRYFEWMDWFFDVLGILLGLFTFTKRL